MLLESLIRIVAPHDCLSCGTEGRLLCPGCAAGLRADLHRHTVPGLQAVDNLQAYSAYDGITKELIQALKFGHCSEAAEHIAGLLRSAPLSPDSVLVPVRTSLQRYRQRGYDQAVLITKHLARHTGLPVADVLVRGGNIRQLGASRAERLRQLRGAYAVRQAKKIASCNIVLVDDVVTTGATLEAAASALLHAGAKSVQALVFAAA